MLVRVTQLVDQLSDPGDRAERDELPPCYRGKDSVLFYAGYDSLDEFHANVAIGCLEDFEIVLCDDEENPVTEEKEEGEERFALISDDRISGPYSRSDAFDLADRGGGQPVRFSTVRHSVIMYNRLVSLSRRLAELMSDVDSAIAWAEGRRDW